MAVQTTQRTPWWRRWWMIVIYDADSFEWRESSFRLPAGESLTVLTAGADGKAPFVAHYRAKNSFGALTLGEAVGYIERDGCVVHLTAAE